MPCFGTTERTKGNAEKLSELLGATVRCIDIKAAVSRHFEDIGHDAENYNVVYENAQARERTQILMDIANACGGMVIGTGDLSELALGWATYNGDQMSMYGVNADIPKTLVRHMVAHCALVAQKKRQKALAAALTDIVNTPVSPELLPANENGEIAQKTEDLVGPYEIHDFYLYYMLRYGFSPEKLYRMACRALGNVYDEETLKQEAADRLKSYESALAEATCHVTKMTELHQCAKDTWDIWQNGGFIARQSALRRLRNLAGFRLESTRIGNYVAKTFDLMNEAQASCARAQQALFSANVSYKIKPDLDRKIAAALRKM